MSLVEQQLCSVKYIFAPPTESPELYTAKYFEICTADVLHDKYEGLHAAVFESCPQGYSCIEPLALYHEVLWYHGIRNGKNITMERDDLHHAINEEEYSVLWGKGVKVSPVTICVDVERFQGDSVLCLS